PILKIGYRTICSIYKGGSMTSDFPISGMALTHILVVSDLNRAKKFYEDVLGASLYVE
ncbi:MAG: VOC family protein, partial [Chloroflexi bacterium]